MTENPLNDAEKEADWKYQLMMGLIENSKKYSGLPSIIPVITHYDYVSEDHDLIHP